MYPLSFFCTRNKNHVPDELKRLEKLPQGLRKANACGGGVRPNEPLGVRAATSNEAGNLTREGGNPLALAMGRMSRPIPHFPRKTGLYGRPLVPLNGGRPFP